MISQPQSVNQFICFLTLDEKVTIISYIFYHDHFILKWQELEFFFTIIFNKKCTIFRSVLYLTLRFLPRWASEDHEFPHYLDICKWFGLLFVVKLMLTDSFLILFMNELSKSRPNYRVHWTLVIIIEKMYYGNTKHAHNFFQISIRITIFFEGGYVFLFCFVVLLIFCHLIFIEKINLPWKISDPAYVEEIFPVFHVPKKSDFVSEETNTPPLSPPPKKSYILLYICGKNKRYFVHYYVPIVLQSYYYCKGVSFWLV